MYIMTYNLPNKRFSLYKTYKKEPIVQKGG